MTSETCCTSIPRAQTSVVIKTRLALWEKSQKKLFALAGKKSYDVPPRNSAIIASLSFCTISPCIDDTVKLAARIFSVNQSTWIENEWMDSAQLKNVRHTLRLV